MRRNLQSLEANLDRVINLAALDLGYTNEEVYGGDVGICEPYDHKKEQKKKRFPTFHVNRIKGDPFDFPDEGEATIKFKVTSRETRNHNGKANNSLSLEIQSIDPVEKKAKKKAELSRRARLTELSARLDDVIEFTDPRPRNQQGMFADSTEAGADPNTMRKAYGSASRIKPDILQKLKRKLPRAMVAPE
jgi:hypothetical protein